MPSTGSVNEPGRVLGPDLVCETKLGVVSAADLTPAFVVDDLITELAAKHVYVLEIHTYPGDNAGVALVLSDENIQLALPLGLLFRSRIATWFLNEHAGHILDDEQPQSVAGMIEEIWLDLDLFLDVR